MLPAASWRWLLQCLPPTDTIVEVTGPLLAVLLSPGAVTVTVALKTPGCMETTGTRYVTLPPGGMVGGVHVRLVLEAATMQPVAGAKAAA